MSKRVFRPLGRLLGGLTLALSCATLGHAADLQPVKFTLDWKFEGPSAPFLLAKEKGYFEAEGLDVTIDAGNGSSGAVTRVASGAYDIAMADLNSMIAFNAQNPEKAMKSMFIVYATPPFALFTKKESGLDSPEKLEGKTLGAPVFDAPRKLFPAFAKATKIDVRKVTWNAMNPPLREPMLVRGEVDGISGFYFTSLLNLEAQGVKKDDLNIFHYEDYGLDLYGNGLIASPEMMKDHPDAIKGFLRAVLKGFKDVIADPAAGIAAIKGVDPLINEDLEKKRLVMALEGNVLTEEVKTHGMGGIQAERMTKAIEQVVFAFDLPSTPKVEEVFTEAFLPAKDLRMIAPK